MAFSTHNSRWLSLWQERAQDHHQSTTSRLRLSRAADKMRGLLPSLVMAAASRKRKRPVHGPASAAIKKRILAGGYTLHRRMASLQGPLPEAKVRAYMRQLLLLTKRANAAGLVHGEIIPGGVHVPGFSPELLEYVTCILLCEGPVADSFALGCVMYELVTGYRLFAADKPMEERIEEGEELEDSLIDLEEGYDSIGLGDLSLHGKQVLSGLLDFFDRDRLTAAKALKHPWFTESSRKRKRATTTRTEPATVEEDA